MSAASIDPVDCGPTWFERVLERVSGPGGDPVKAIERSVP